jgi:hypothetical protein
VPFVTPKRVPRNVRFAPKSGHCRATAECPLCAKSGPSATQQKLLYSITWLAVASSDDGTVRPSAFAVLTLITSSNFTGC